MEIITGVHVIPSPIVNFYLIVDGDGLTLIDTGLPGNDQRILKTITGIGRKPEDLKRIVITHADGDHVGSLAALQAVTGARVYASRVEAGGEGKARASALKQAALGARIVCVGHGPVVRDAAGKFPNV